LSADTNHPHAVSPESKAVFNPEKMGKSTIFRSEHVLVGLNAFEPGQEHRLHTHEGMDKVYHVLKGRGRFILEDREIEMEAGLMLVAPVRGWLFWCRLRVRKRLYGALNAVVAV